MLKPLTVCNITNCGKPLKRWNTRSSFLSPEKPVCGSGISISLRAFHRLLWSTKGFSIVNETEVNVFPEFPCFIYDPASVGYLISGSSAFSKPTLGVWKFLTQVMLKPSMQDFKHDLNSMGDECNCLMVCIFLVLPFSGIGSQGSDPWRGHIYTYIYIP